MLPPSLAVYQAKQKEEMYDRFNLRSMTSEVMQGSGREAKQEEVRDI